MMHALGVDKARTRRLAMIAASALAAITLDVSPASAGPDPVEGEPPATGESVPVVFSGATPTGTENVRVLVDPDDTTIQSLTVGEGYTPYELPTESVKVDGSTYQVELDTADLPDGYLNPDGVATFNVLVEDQAGGSWVTTASARAVFKDSTAETSPSIAWIDPMFGDLSEPATTAQKSDAAGNSLSVVDDTSLTQASDVVVADLVPLEGQAIVDTSDDGEPVDAADIEPLGNDMVDVDDGSYATAACGNGNPGTTYWRLLETSNRNAVVRSAYPVGDTETQVSYTTGSTGTYGVGVSASGAFGSYEASGTKLVSSDYGHTSLRYTGGRRYRKLINYGKYRVEITDVWGDCHYHSRQWRARLDTGGPTSVAVSSRPNYTYCVNVDPGPWHRDSSSGTAYSWSLGVEISGKIGIDLSSAKQYTTDNRVTYYIAGTNKRICGSNNYPSVSKYQMEKYR